MIGKYTSSLILKTADSGLYLVTGMRNHENIWCYLAIPISKVSIFLKALANPTIDLAKYGKPLFSGTGTTPPDEIKRIIQHHFVDNTAA